MRALTVRQPWAQLLVMGTKTIETRTRRAPASAIGQRIAITASARPPAFDRVGNWRRYKEAVLDDANHVVFRVRALNTEPERHGADRRWLDLPLGVVVGSGVLTASVPMIEQRGMAGGPDVLLTAAPMTLLTAVGEAACARATNVEDQRPFGDFSPGRWAWIFDDLAPITERCPVCWGGTEHVTYRRHGLWASIAPAGCPTCHGRGRLDPPPVKGRLGVWNWTPEGSE